MIKTKNKNGGKPPKIDALVKCPQCNAQYNQKHGKICPACRLNILKHCNSCNAPFKVDKTNKHWKQCQQCFRGDSYDINKEVRHNTSKPREQKTKSLINNSLQEFIPAQVIMNPNVNVGQAGNVNVPPPPPLMTDVNNKNTQSVPTPDTPIIKFTLPPQEEETTPEEYDFDDLEPFQYATTRIWLWLEWRVYKWDVLPKDFIKYILKYKHTTNTMTYRTWQLLLKSDPYIVKYVEAFYVSHSLVECEDFIESYHNFFFSHKQPMAKYTFALNAANSNVFEITRKVYNTHSSQRPLTGTDLFSWWSVLKWACIGVAATAATIYLYKYIKDITSVEYILRNLGSDTKYIPSFVRIVTPFATYTRENANRTIDPDGYDGPHTLIHTFPNFSRYLEEVIKCCPKGWWLVSALERLKYGHWGTYNWHKESSSWSFSERLRKHKNKQYRPEKQGLLYQEYSSYVLYGTAPNYDEVVEEMHSPYLPSRILPIPKETRPFIPYKILNIDNVHDDTNYEGVYPMMYCVNTMVRPAPTWDNQAATIIERITGYDNATFDPTHPIHKTVLRSLSQQISFSHNDNPHWFEELTGPQKQNLYKVQEQHKNGIVETSINCQIKGDELINGKTKSVARFICNLSGEDFYYQGKLTSEISNWLADHWGPRALNGFTYKTFFNRIYFTCGATSKSLDGYVNHVVENKLNGQLVMGDDTFMIKNDSPQMYIIENDFSRYDRTHHKELRNIFHDRLFHSGYAELVMHRNNMYKKNLSFREKIKKGHTKLPNPNFVFGTKNRIDQLMTGEPGTCLVNSFTNALTSTYIFSDPINNPVTYKTEKVETFRQCGLICKDMSIHTEISDATFLKGTFLLGVDQKYHWIRLPSFLSKFGKVLKPHNIILNNKKLNPNLRARMLLKAQWLGYGDMDTNWFYKAIGEQIHRITGTHLKVEPDKLKFWQVQQSKCSIPDETWNTFMLKRYDVSVEDMNSYINTLKSIDPIMLPCIYYNAMVQKLVDRDY